jgi:hypothetical protein
LIPFNPIISPKVSTKRGLIFSFNNVGSK